MCAKCEPKWKALQTTKKNLGKHAALAESVRQQLAEIGDPPYDPDFPYKEGWQVKDWQQLSKEQQGEADYRRSSVCKVGHIEEAADISYTNRTRGDIVGVEDLLPKIAELMQGGDTGFTFAARKKTRGGISTPVFESGIAVAVQYTEHDIKHKPSFADDADDFQLSAASDLIDWLEEHSEEMAHPNAMIGGYYNSEEGIMEINITIVFHADQEAEARRLAENGNQYSAWDFSADDGRGGKGAEIPTGGSGKHPKPPGGW